MSDANRDKLLRVSGMLEGLICAVSGDAADGLVYAVEMLEEVIKSEGRCSERKDT